MAKAKFSIMGVSPETVCDKGFEFEITHPDPDVETGIGMFITVVGSASPKVKAYQRAGINQRLKLEAKGGDSAVLTVEALEASAIDRAVACTVSWRGVVWNEGEDELPFDEENAKRLYAQEFVRSQVLQRPIQWETSTRASECLRGVRCAPVRVEYKARRRQHIAGTHDGI